ncbi:MAG TPA: WbqC family protein [Cyclobacteriaceae bacterium]|nr:WbqC family protein [Cyclobacteriaceae bacterium]
MIEEEDTQIAKPIQAASTRVVADLFYLPPIEFFVAVQDAEEIIIEAQDNYQKQSFRNRCTIQLANQVKSLSIPVSGGNKKIKYKDVKMDDSQNWRNIHLRSVQSAYGKAPFFEYFYPGLEKVFQKNHVYLYDFNYELLTLCLHNLRYTAKLRETSSYGQQVEEIDLRGLLNAKVPFEDRNIYKPYPYVQIFGLNFAPNLSVIDLLFCEGPNSNKVIFHSQKN